MLHATFFILFIVSKLRNGIIKKNKNKAEKGFRFGEQGRKKRVRTKGTDGCARGIEGSEGKG